MRKLLFSLAFCGVLYAFTVSGCKNASAESGDNTAVSSDRSFEDAAKALKAIEPNSNNIWDTHLDSMPDDDCQKLQVNPPPGYLRKWFCDSNYLHYAAGQQLGITPVMTPADVMKIKGDLIQVESCEDFYVDSLRHSYPYLVPHAATLLHDIGRSFNDSLRARGGGCYRLKVTSVLRTDQSIRRLRRVNRIAVDSSSHRFGTTFDISYSNFICDATTVNRTAEDLKNLLAEILHSYRQQGRCLVIYERKQACFHITALTAAYRRPAPPAPEDK